MTNIRQTENNTQKNDHKDYYYNNNITHGAGRVLQKKVLMPDEQDLIREAYVDNIGEMTGAAAKLIETAYSSGLTAEEIVMAIEDTGLAPRPSAFYLKKILENWAENGVTVSRLRHEVKANEGRKWWKG